MLKIKGSYMSEKLSKIFFFLSLILAITIVFAIAMKPNPIFGDYSKEVVVDNSEKVERALEIAIEDVKSRRFVVVKIDTLSCGGKFIVKCYGIDKGNLLKMD